MERLDWFSAQVVAVLGGQILGAQDRLDFEGASYWDAAGSLWGQPVANGVGRIGVTEALLITRVWLRAPTRVGLARLCAALGHFLGSIHVASALRGRRRPRRSCVEPQDLQLPGGFAKAHARRRARVGSQQQQTSVVVNVVRPTSIATSFGPPRVPGGDRSAEAFSRTRRPRTGRTEGDRPTGRRRVDRQVTRDAVSFPTAPAWRGRAALALWFDSVYSSYRKLGRLADGPRRRG
jgi:hypothetical protein